MPLHHPHHVLRPIGWDDARAAELDALGDPSLRPARCARVDRGGLLALAPEGPLALRRSVPMAAGDWLALSGGTVAHVLARRGTVARRAPGRAAGEQAIAANVDVLVAVLGLDRPLRLGRLRRALALAEQGDGAVRRRQDHPHQRAGRRRPGHRRGPRRWPGRRRPARW